MQWLRAVWSPAAKKMKFGSGSMAAMASSRRQVGSRAAGRGWGTATRLGCRSRSDHGARRNLQQRIGFELGHVESGDGARSQRRKKGEGSLTPAGASVVERGNWWRRNRRSSSELQAAGQAWRRPGTVVAEAAVLCSTEMRWYRMNDSWSLDACYQ